MKTHKILRNGIPIIFMLTLLGGLTYAFFALDIKKLKKSVDEGNPHVGDVYVWIIPDEINRNLVPEEIRGMKIYRRITRIEEREHVTWFTYESLNYHITREIRDREFLNRSEKVKSSDIPDNLK